MFLILFRGIFMNGYIPSESMEPTLKNGQNVIVKRNSYKIKEVERGDIIVFVSNKKDIVKRVIGLPGDKVEIKDDRVYINGALYDESYSCGDTESEQNEYQVPDNKYFVLGDNRENSDDSRLWSDPYVDRKDIIGKVIAGYSFGGAGFFIKKY